MTSVPTTGDTSRERLRAWTRAYARPIASFVLIGALLCLSDSYGPSQKAATEPFRRVIAATGGRYTPDATRALTRGMNRFELTLAHNNIPGTSEWTPGGPLGWAVYDVETPPSLIWRDLTFDDARDINDLVPMSPLPIKPMPGFVLPAKGSERDRALNCMTQAVYFEAGFESGEGQQAVAQVILNRLRHPAYPKSVCGVVYQGSQRQTGCQFSFTCDGSLSRPVNPAAWQRASYVAQQALSGFVYKGVGPATHYHADYVFPYWAVTLVKLTQIGAHIFYRMTGPGGSPDAFRGQYAGGETALSLAVLTGGDTRTPDAPAAVLPPTLAQAVARTVTLGTGGEARTYTVAAPIGEVAPGSTAESAGVIRPGRRQPTPEEIKAINDSLLKFEEDRKAAADAANAQAQAARAARVLEANGSPPPVAPVPKTP